MNKTQEEKFTVEVTRTFMVDLFALQVSYMAMLKNPDTTLRPPEGALDRLAEWSGKVMEKYGDLIIQ